MKHTRRPQRAAAIVAAAGMLLQPTTHLVAAMASQGQAAAIPRSHGLGHSSIENANRLGYLGP